MSRCSIEPTKVGLLHVNKGTGVHEPDYPIVVTLKTLRISVKGGDKIVLVGQLWEKYRESIDKQLRLIESGNPGVKGVNTIVDWDIGNIRLSEFEPNYINMTGPSRTLHQSKNLNRLNML